MAFNLGVSLKKMQANIGGVIGKFGRLDQALVGADAGRYALAQQAAQFVTPLVRRAYIQAYQSSGLKTRSGNLLRAVQTCVVYVGKTGLLVRFPSGLKDQIYVQGASLQYGYVKVPKIFRQKFDLPTGRSVFGKFNAIGAKAKRSIKTAVFSGAGLSKRSASRIAKGAKGPLFSQKGFDVGQAKVIAPKPFFRLNDFQKSDIQAQFLGRLNYLISRQISQKASA